MAQTSVLSHSRKQTDILLEAGTNEVEVFEFNLGGHHYGVNVAKVNQIVQREQVKITRADLPPRGVLGTIPFRGKPIMTLDLRTMVEHSLDAVRPLIDSKRHSLCVNVPEAALALHGDPVRLTQVLGNLLTNAARYTPEGGTIAITFDHDEDGFLGGFMAGPLHTLSSFHLLRLKDRALFKGRNLRTGC